MNDGCLHIAAERRPNGIASSVSVAPPGLEATTKSRSGGFTPGFIWSSLRDLEGNWWLRLVGDEHVLFDTVQGRVVVAFKEEGAGGHPLVSLSAAA